MTKRAFVIMSLAAFVAAISAMATRVQAQSSGSALVVSQIYGGGGLPGATHQNDYVVVFNRSDAPADLTGWSIQFASAIGGDRFSDNPVTVVSGEVQPGQHYLVRLASGGANGAVLPAQDASGTGNLPTNGGKVILAFGTTGVACNGGSMACSGAQRGRIIDLVGYGSANFFEGAGAAPTLDVSTAALRLAGGCEDTNSNVADFAAGTPAPLNMASPATPCAGATNPTLAASASPNPVLLGQTLVVTALLTPGENPPSTGLQVQGDFSPFGGLMDQGLLDNGVAPDAEEGDLVFTGSVLVSMGTVVGFHQVDLTVSDAEGRASMGSVEVEVASPTVVLFPHDIQGLNHVSPYVGEVKTVRGLLTALTHNGFFMQTEPDEDDGDPLSSEGLFVRTTVEPTGLAVGDLVELSGTVVEFVPPADPNQPSVTELVQGGDEGASVTVLSSGNALPAVQLVDNAMLTATGEISMENLEGMRVEMMTTSHGMAVVDPTRGGFSPSEASGTAASDGVFYTTFSGVARPAREPGVHTFDHDAFAALCASAPCAIPEFDGNPERVRVDSDAQLGAAAVDVTTGQGVTGVVGVLHYDARTWTVFPDPGSLVVVGAPATPAGAAPAGATQFTVGSLNLGRLFDTSDDPTHDDVVLSAGASTNHLARASLAVRTALGSPDVVGVQEVENLATLSALADRVNSDAGLACPGAPGCYSAHLLEGNDASGLDVGFLVRQRVTVSSVVQEGLASTFADPDDNSVDLLFDHPPLVLRGTVNAPAGHLDQEVVVVVHHMEPLAGADSTTSARVRAKRQKQAEAAANLLQNLQSGPVPVVSLGNYNAYDVNDGLVDVMGTVLGSPAAPDQVVLASSDGVNPDFVNATGGTYSSVNHGSTQALDHVLVSQSGDAMLAGVTVARINADFPEMARNDATMPLRLSDRDPAVAYFDFTPDTVPPVISGTPANMTVEGNTLGGAVVNYSEPTALDAVDGPVTVLCSPGSGATFNLGLNTVTCSASDAAGNLAQTSFTVTVQDTTKPALTLPANITRTATSASGAVVTYTATAMDLVSGALTPLCTPASGSLFPVGTTTVGCVATDGSGNSASGSFLVTVNGLPSGPVEGAMEGVGRVGLKHDYTDFAFHVKEKASGVERGWLVLQVKDGWKTHVFVSNRVSSVKFSNSPGFSPGPTPASGVDTVTFSGVGWWRGKSGHTFVVTAADHGSSKDTFSVVVKNSRGLVVAEAEGRLTKGFVESLRVK